MKRLLAIEEIPPVPGIEVPSRFYQVLSDPAPLAGMAFPSPGTPWRALADSGFRWVLNLAGTEPGYNPDPLKILRTLPLEDLYSGDPPQDPGREEQLIRDAVAAILDRLKVGEGVTVHCMGGTGRTGTVLGCVLRRLGFPAEEVIHYLDVLNRARGKHGWPESSWQAEVVRGWR